MSDDLTHYMEAAARLKAENRMLRDTLRHIADEQTWRLTDELGTRVGGGFLGESIRHKASEALAKLEES